MTDIQSLIQQLAEAQRSGTHPVDAAAYATLDRPDAYRIQVGVLDALSETVGMLKTAVHSDRVGVVAPIYAQRVGQSPTFELPVANVTGLEVEVGLVLGQDVGPDSDPAAGVGVEICGTRYADRSLSGANGGLADNMSALGYCIGPRRAAGTSIDNLEIKLEFAGQPIYSAPARHGFGSVLASLVAYAKNQHPRFPLRAGTVVTTGSMCGLVPTTGPGHVVAKLGAETVEFDIV